MDIYGLLVAARRMFRCIQNNQVFPILELKIARRKIRVLEFLANIYFFCFGQKYNFGQKYRFWLNFLVQNFYGMLFTTLPHSDQVVYVLCFSWPSSTSLFFIDSDIGTITESTEIGIISIVFMYSIVSFTVRHVLSLFPIVFKKNVMFNQISIFNEILFFVKIIV